VRGGKGRGVRGGKGRGRRGREGKRTGGEREGGRRKGRKGERDLAPPPRKKSWRRHWQRDSIIYSTLYSKDQGVSEV